MCVSGFRVPPLSDNPDLTIDEELNMVEPKIDFWRVLFKPKAKSTFKEILKLLNNFDSRNKYTTDDKPIPKMSKKPVQSETNLPPSRSQNIGVDSFNKNDEHFIVREEFNPGIVSEEIGEKESLSEEHRSRIAAASISVESNENSSEDTSKINSSQNSESEESSKDSSSEQSQESKTGNDKKTEEVERLETVRYQADLPKSLHHFQIDKPKYQHSIRDGWSY